MWTSGFDSGDFRRREYQWKSRS